jgi:hypothetical protein
MSSLPSSLLRRRRRRGCRLATALNTCRLVPRRTRTPRGSDREHSWSTSSRSRNRHFRFRVRLLRLVRRRPWRSPPPSRTAPPPIPPPENQSHHSFSSIFKRYLFRGKLRENQHRMRWATATGGGDGGRGVHCGAHLDGLPLLRGRPLPPSHLPTAKATTASVVSSNGTFLWGKLRENQHHMRWATATGGGGGSRGVHSMMARMRSPPPRARGSCRDRALDIK